MVLEKGSRELALSFVVVVFGCEPGAAPSGAERPPDLAVHDQALACLRGPVFPSCYFVLTRNRLVEHERAGEA